ncbi:hypothetical protein F4818DRAFT_341465 [Hypoxylon cercidicola]|nr:hypothetical protein F4818DRAFT_341465 [Hypoxylon cercidicola]
MEVLAAGVAYTINNFSPQKVLTKLGLASLIASNVNLLGDLGPKLSPEASILLPGDAEFANLTSRWREWHAPNIAAVVEVATEADVQQTVRYANERGIPFIARSGGHGATEALASALNAIQIDFRRLNQVKISEDGSTVTIGGGARVKELVDTLTESGKQTVTGVCECVGISAPILGGGHGWLQGQYGLLADQVISARLILPSGDVVTVSESSNPDLFWAIKGAGHNFGLVTEWEYRIYDAKYEKWSYEIFIFSGDKLEGLYELTNEMLKSQPPQVIHWSYIFKVAEIDPDHPIIWYAIIYDGPIWEAREYAKPLHDIDAIMVNAGDATTSELASLSFQSEDAPGCAKGLTSLRYPIGLKSYNTATVRKVYDEIDATFREVPELAASVFLLEGYSNQGVQAVDASSTAFPHRDDKILVTSYLQYQPNATIDPIAQAFGKKLRSHLLQGSDDPAHLRAYVNYAHGDESPQEVYGWEEWRLEKLKKLKMQWDPENRMRYYVPFL